MKQYITIEQLNELDENEKDKLREWYIPKYGDSFMMIPDCNSEPTCCWKKDESLLPFPSIGQMIEFLEEHGEYPDCFIQDYYGSECDCGGLNCGAEFYSADKLCDSLWEEVKDVLTHKPI